MGMTIAIKDFEMPQSCYNCNFCLRRRTSDYGYFGMCDLTNEDGINLYEHSRSEDCPLVEAIPKADYENRLKADMVAMLEEIRAEMEHVEPHDIGESIVRNACKQVVDIRINALKEDTDGKVDRYR